MHNTLTTVLLQTIHDKMTENSSANFIRCINVIALPELLKATPKIISSISIINRSVSTLLPQCISILVFRSTYMI